MPVIRQKLRGGAAAVQHRDEEAGQQCGGGREREAEKRAEFQLGGEERHRDCVLQFGEREGDNGCRALKKGTRIEWDGGTHN